MHVAHVITEVLRTFETLLSLSHSRTDLGYDTNVLVQ